MLKRKLTKAIFGGHALFLLIILNIAAKRPDALLSYLAISDTTILQQAATDSIDEGMPQIRLNDQASTYVSSYIRKNSADLDKIKSRSKAYFKVMDAIFTEYHLPLELKYLAVVESDLKNTALSQVGAAGPWQLMPGTAKLLGLKIGKHYDERTHTRKSTVAAAKYLKDLYADLGDWLLVVAAYNSGPGKVYSAIRKSGSRNFWKLQNFLPAETRAHVKHYIGVHYYFENRASETTQTRAELTTYEQELASYLAKQKSIPGETDKLALEKNDTPASPATANTVSVNTAAVLTKDK